MKLTVWQNGVKGSDQHTSGNAARGAYSADDCQVGSIACCNWRGSRGGGLVAIHFRHTQLQESCSQINNSAWDCMQMTKVMSKRLVHLPVSCRLGHLLCNVLCPRAVLALTATATPPTRACIRQLLAIPPEHQLVESPLRDNLRLRVVHCNGASKGGGVAASVVQLLTTGVSGF